MRSSAWPAAGAALLLLTRADVRPIAAATPDGLHVRASAAFAPCLEPALDAFTRATGVPATLATADPDPPEDADLVVGDDLEMTRLLESGAAEVATASDLGQIPWVLVVPAGAPAGGVSALTADPVSVLAGPAGREARDSLSALSPSRLALSSDRAELQRARPALLPRSLAGTGERRPSAVRPLIATAAIVSASPRKAQARRLLAFLAGPDGRRALGSCFDPMPSSAAVAPTAHGASGASTTAVRANYAQAVVDWWLPQCTLEHNSYNDPEEVLGPPDAVNLGGNTYQGFMSLGQGGYVTVDMGTTFTDGPGPDVRVYQAVSGAGEPVTLYAASSPSGPFTMVGLRVPCGVRTPGLFSNHCDFDLAAGGVASARYLKIEDGEIYPCLSGGTDSEGTDIDAVEILGH
jgi:hypothetical protein